MPLCLSPDYIYYTDVRDELEPRALLYIPASLRVPYMFKCSTYSHGSVLRERSRIMLVTSIVDYASLVCASVPYRRIYFIDYIILIILYNYVNNFGLL